MKYEEMYESIKEFMSKESDAAIQIDVPQKNDDERIVSLISPDNNKELIFSKKEFDTKYLFEILKLFSNLHGNITNRTLVNQDKYFIELKTKNDASLYLNNFNEKIINKVRFYVNNQNRIQNGKEARAQEKNAFVSVSVLFVISMLSIVLISMLVLAL